MAKNKLKGLGRKKLQSRKVKKLSKREKLQQELKATKKGGGARKVIKKNIEKNKEKTKKINTAINKIDAKKEVELQGRPSEELLAELYTSPEFQGMSTANQELIKEQIDSFTPDEVVKLKLSNKQVENLYKEGRNAARPDRDKKIDEYNMDFEEEKRGDLAALEVLLERGEINLSTMEKGTYEYEQAVMTIRDLRDALGTATAQYQEAADVKNLLLQNKLEDAKHDLDRETLEANEDKIIELRGLERRLNGELRQVQESMESRGMLLSGKRFRAEEELEDQYADDMTTSELIAMRRVAAAERTEMETRRNSLLLNREQLSNLFNKYGIEQRDAIQSAESILGTKRTEGQLGDFTGVAGTNLNDYLYRDITGQQKLTANETSKAELAEYERKFGSKAIGKVLEGYDDTGYKQVGGLEGTTKTQRDRDEEAAREEFRVDTEDYVQTAKDQSLIAKTI